MKKKTKDQNYLKIIAHYEDCLEKYGDTHLGVDWPNATDALTRYQVMLDVIRPRPLPKVSVLDFGCGASHLYDYILAKGLSTIEYSGLDISEKFINLSEKKYPGINYYCLDILKSSAQLPLFDYIILNGVFTEKRELSHDEMWEYLRQVILKVFKLAKSGISFNVMSSHVDWERDDLFHLPMDKLATFLVKEVSRDFIIRNDYQLYEYTTYVYRS
jgi:2-polyprenyl-3-methyl-5-hydroxy-6-metoxy-1,4-benzoquinol methylase